MRSFSDVLYRIGEEILVDPSDAGRMMYSIGGTTARERRSLVALPPAARERVFSERPACIICFGDEIHDRTVLVCCGSSYCGECIRQWIAQRNTCPLCRALLTNKLVVRCDDRTFSEMSKPDFKPVSPPPSQRPWWLCYCFGWQTPRK